VARADYFDRAVQAAFHVLDDLDQPSFLKKVDRHRVAVAFDSSALSVEGEAAVDMTIRLLARFYPKIAIIPLDEIAQLRLSAYKTLAHSINPKIAILEHARGVKDIIVIGNTPPPPKKNVVPIYVGSDGWIAKLSRNNPVGSKASGNPLGAGFAACLAAANVFRNVFTDVPLDDEVNLSLMDLNHHEAAPPNPEFSHIDLGEVFLVGAGAVGNGFLWAILRSVNLTGNLKVIDHDEIDLFNLQRYVLTERSHNGTAKAEMAASLFADHPGIQVTSISEKWEDFVSNLPEGQWLFDKVVSALDSPEDRINLQASLPKWVVNAWTGAGDSGASYHDFINHACMACLYMPTGEVLNEDQLIAQALGLEQNRETLLEIRKKVETASPVDRAFLERIAEAKGIQIDKLIQFEGQTLRTLYTKGVCSGAVMELANGPSNQRAEVPMPFQSALSGILQAAFLIAHADGSIISPKMTRINLMKPIPIPSKLSWTPPKSSQCICRDGDYRDVYLEKYGAG
jgi:hypothetical protein